MQVRVTSGSVMLDFTEAVIFQLSLQIDADVRSGRRRGTDVTVVSWSRMVDLALQVADIVAQRGISAEVIDLRTVSPWTRTQSSSR